MTRAAVRCGPLAWVGLAVAALMCLSVFLVNKAPLYYFDSLGYYVQGSAILDGLTGAQDTDDATGAADAAGAKTPADKSRDDQVSGNRSATYAVIFAALWQAGGPWVPVIVNFAMVLVAAFLVARVISRSIDRDMCPTTLVALPLGVAALTSLPFYIAFLMPDILTALALLAVALVAAFSRDMRPGELALAFVLIVAGTVSHRSTLVIVGLLVPVTALAAAFTAGGKWWLPTALVALATLIGIAELKGYEKAADKVFEKHAVFSPFLTARFIADGPGYTFLQEHCPDPEIQTCKLAEALSWSDDPYRLTASHILFERSERLGSFMRMPPDDQRAVADEQREFVLRVFADQPVGVLMAVLGNTLEQTWRVSVDMTVPDERIMARPEFANISEVTDFGRLTADRGWIDTLNLAHLAIYAVSAVALILGLALPGSADRRLKVMAVMIVLAILANAFVCGAVSQPATRYGSRVAWLLPYLATILTVFSVRALSQTSTRPAVSK
ncbi:MAG: hypothetical protein ACWA5A_05885 [Marinibacterium sp.]